MYHSTRYEQARNDNEPGYIYLMEAVGYHGILPGCYLRRCKIGLSRNPELRLENFHANQPPCNVKILKTVYVEDMKAVEERLHTRFKRCNVKLFKSREWFDLSPLDFLLVIWSFSLIDRSVSVQWAFSERSPYAKWLIMSGLVILLLTVISGQFQTVRPSTHQQHISHRKSQ